VYRERKGRFCNHTVKGSTRVNGGGTRSGGNGGENTKWTERRLAELRSLKSYFRITIVKKDWGGSFEATKANLSQ